MRNPWLDITDADYIGHMSSPAVNCTLARRVLEAAGVEREIGAIVNPLTSSEMHTIRPEFWSPAGGGGTGLESFPLRTGAAAETLTTTPRHHRATLAPMARGDKVLQRILHGGADANIDFSELCRLLRTLGFDERVRGSHHIFIRPGVEELLNLQQDGANAKAYQVRQVRAVILKYNLGFEA